jgi:hypothetical protein
MIIKEAIGPPKVTPLSTQCGLRDGESNFIVDNLFYFIQCCHLVNMLLCYLKLSLGEKKMKIKS